MCPEHDVSETLYYQWRDELLEGGAEALRSARERAKDPRGRGLKDAKGRIASNHGHGLSTRGRSRPVPQQLPATSSPYVFLPSARSSCYPGRDLRHRTGHKLPIDGDIRTRTMQKKTCR